MKKFISAAMMLSLLVVRQFSIAQSYIANDYAAEYLRQMEGVTDQAKVSEIRKSILSRDDIPIEQRTDIVKQIGDKHLQNIEEEGDRELAWIRTEAAISAAIRLANYGCAAFVPAYKDPAVISAVDSFAQAILDGKARDAIVKVIDNGDWSGINQVAASVGVGALLGYVLDPKVLGPVIQKTPIANLRNQAAQFGNKVKDGVLKISENSALREKISLYTTKASDLYDDVYRNLQPRIGEMKGELADLYRKLNRATSEEEKAAINATITQMEQEVADLGAQVAKKQLEINNVENVIEKLTYDFKQSAQSVADNLLGQVDNAIQTFVKKLKVFNGHSFEEVQDFVATQVGNLANTMTEAQLRIVDLATEFYVTEKMNAAEREYERNAAQIENDYGSGRVVLQGGVEENIYVDKSTGEVIQLDDNNQPANNLLNEAFKDDPAEPKDAQTLANEAFNKEIDKMLKGVEDQSLAQKIKDFVTGKIDEAIQKGEEWIENGGIRKTILEQVDKMLEGKVSSEDAQRIHSLVDTLCNVNKDGGESFCNTLGTDGKDLAVSLAVEALKKQLAGVLPEDAADMVNAMLDVLKENGTSEDYKKAVLGQIQDLITKYVPYENTANTLNDIIQNISNGNAIDAIDSIKDVGKNLGVDMLKDVISKNIDPEVAARINALLDGFAKDGVQGMSDAALKEIYDLIDQYAPGADSAQKLKDVIRGTLDGTVTGPDFANASTTIATDGLKKLINNSDLPQEVKDVANTAIDGLAENGIAGVTENVGNYIQDYVTDQLGKDAGNAVRDIYDAVVTPGVDAWDAVVKNAPTIGKAIGQKVLAWAENTVAAQINKLIAKYPKLKSVLDRLGINGAGIVQGVKNVLSVLWNAPSLKDALTQLGTMAANFLKGIAGKLIDMALEYAVNWLVSNLVPKVVNWATSTLQKWADSASNPLVKKGLEWLAGQVKNCAKCANVKIKVSGPGDKVIKWADSKINARKNTATTTVIETK